MKYVIPFQTEESQAAIVEELKLDELTVRKSVSTQAFAGLKYSPLVV